MIRIKDIGTFLKMNTAKVSLFHSTLDTPGQSLCQSPFTRQNEAQLSVLFILAHNFLNPQTVSKQGVL